MHPLHCTFDAGSLFLNVFLFIQARTMGFVLLAFIGNFSALLKIELKLDFCISSLVILGATRDRTYTTSSHNPLISDPFPPLVINFIMWAVGFSSQVVFLDTFPSNLKTTQFMDEFQATMHQKYFSINSQSTTESFDLIWFCLKLKKYFSRNRRYK